MISRSLVFRRLLCRGWTGLDTQAAEQGGHVGSEMFAVLWEPGGEVPPGYPTPVDSPARVCPRHALAALNGITGAHVNWPDSKGLNEWERKALELAEERSQLG